MSLSKISRILLTVLGLKLFVLCFMLVDSGLPSLPSFFSSSAEAADSPAAGAAPTAAGVVQEGADGVIDQRGVVTPMSQPGTGGGAASLSQPGMGAGPTTLPSISGAAPGSAGMTGQQRALPSIQQNRQGAASAALPTSPDTPATAPLTPSSAAESLARDALAKRQDDLARKEQDLRALEVDIASKIEEMQLLESRLQSMMKQAKETDDAKFRHTVDVLSNMKSKQAAAVLTTLDEKIAVRVLAKMRGRQAGEILTFVPPQKAARLTEALVRMQMPYE